METEEGAARLLQAHIRGFLVRQKLRRLHQEYLMVVKEIEGEDVVLFQGKWLLSFPQLCTLDKDQVTKPHRPNVSVKETSNMTPRVKGTLDSLQTKPSETSMPWVGSEKDVQTLRKQCYLTKICACLPESDVQTRKSDIIEEKSIPYFQRTKAEREGHFQDTVIPVTESCVNDPMRETSHTETDAQVQEAHHTETDIFVREDCHRNDKEIEDTPVQTNCVNKDFLSAVSNPGIEHCLLDCDNAMTAIQIPEPKRNASLWSEENDVNRELTMKSLSELRKQRSHLAMEILWVQQAISSRKNYLMVKQKLGACD